MDSRAEPSMEEILASIRRIITEDTPPLPAGEPSVPAPAPFRPMAPEVLELTAPMADEPLPEPSDAAPPAPAGPAPDGSARTLEAVVRDMLQPMLRQWLDAHLPAIVERLVAAEVRRITGRD